MWGGGGVCGAPTVERLGPLQEVGACTWGRTVLTVCVDMWAAEVVSCRRLVILRENHKIGPTFQSLKQLGAPMPEANPTQLQSSES